MNSIFARRSIRKYAGKKIPAAMIEKLMKAGMAAPSAGNEQPWHFIYINDRALFKEIREIHPYSGMLEQADGAILVCGDLALEKHAGYWVQDCSAATQNILLEAQELGLGAVWLGVYPVKDRVAGLSRLFNLPDRVIPLSLISLGFPGEEKEPADRYDPGRVHKNGW